MIHLGDITKISGYTAPERELVLKDNVAVCLWNRSEL